MAADLELETVRVAGATPPSLAPRRDLTWLRRLRVWLVLVPAAMLLVQGWHQRWLSDDGFIHVRVAEQVLAGHGFVFNATERVEASTSPLWVAVLALARVPHLFRLEAAAVVIGLISTTAGLLLAAWGARLLWRPEGVLPVGATVLAVLPPMWDFATSGLEVGLVFLWLGGCFRLLARLTVSDEPRWSQLRLVAFVAGAGPLIRPDLILFTGVFLLAALFRASQVTPRPWRQLPALLGLALTMPCAYQLFRMGYYGSLVPSTALAKEASRAWWTQGWRYLLDLVGPYRLWVPLSAVLLLLAAEARRWLRSRSTHRLVITAAPLVGGTAHALYITRVGGDFMHGRLLLPALFALLMPVAVIEVRGWRRGAAAAVVAVWAVVCLGWLRPSHVAGRNGTDMVAAGIADERAFYAALAGRHNPVDVDDYASSGLYAHGLAARRLGRPTLGFLTPDPGRPYGSVALRPDVPFHTAFATPNVGITAVIAGTDVHIIDVGGLADPVASRLRLAARGRPGHEKRLDLAWILARFADPRAPIPEGVSAPAVRAAHHALRCGPLRDVQEAATRPLTIARFARNVGVSVRLRSFRLDSDPAVAEAKLCRS